MFLLVALCIKRMGGRTLLLTSHIRTGASPTRIMCNPAAAPRAERGSVPWQLARHPARTHRQKESRNASGTLPCGRHGCPCHAARLYTGILASRPNPTHAEAPSGGLSSQIPCTIAGAPSTCTLTIRYERKPAIHATFLTLACALICLGRLG